MRPRREPRLADVADDLALLHPRADLLIPRVARKMPVQLRDSAAVVDLDGVALAALRAALEDPAVDGGVDGRAGRRRVLVAAVRAGRVQRGMAADRVEGRADGREVRRRAQEGHAQAGAIRRVVLVTYGRVRITRGAIDSALVH